MINGDGFVETERKSTISALTDPTTFILLCFYACKSALIEQKNSADFAFNRNKPWKYSRSQSTITENYSEFIETNQKK